MTDCLRVLALATTLVLADPSAAEERGPFPQPRDPDGRFENLTTKLPVAGVDVTFPFFLRRLGQGAPDAADLPARVENDGSFLRSNARGRVPTITWIGHATLLVQVGDQTFLTDPMFTQRASPFAWIGPKRFQPPGIALDDLPPIDFVLVSHNHYDHLDIPSLAEIALRNTRARFLVPLENGELLSEAGIPNVEEFAWGQTTRIGDLEIHCLPSQHWSRRGLFDGNAALWASWAVIGPTERFYFAGDTGYFATFNDIGGRLGPFDVAAVPIGAYRPREMMRAFHMNPAEAVQAGRDLDAHRLIGMHYGTFDLSDEPPSEASDLFRRAGKESGYHSDQILLPAIGETLHLRSGTPLPSAPPDARHP